VLELHGLRLAVDDECDFGHELFSLKVGRTL
jgi:hypothetical protein